MPKTKDGEVRPRDGRGWDRPASRDAGLTTEEWLRKRAATLRARAEKIRREADELAEEADRLEQTARELAARQRGSGIGEHLAFPGKHLHLRVREHRPRVEAEMEMAQLGAAISKGKARAAQKAGETIDALVLAAQAKGLSLRGLANEAAEALGRTVPPSGLSQARRGARPIAPDLAAFIEQRIGFVASAKNWPGGIA